MAVDYSLPPWLQFNPADRINSAVIAGRAADARNRAQSDQEQSTEFEQGRETTEDEQKQQEFQQRAQAAAAHLADMQGYQNDVASGMNPATAALKHPIAFSGRLPAAAFAPTKPAVTPGFQPLTPSGAQSVPAPGGTPAPITPPAAAPANPQWLQPPGTFTDERGHTTYHPGIPVKPVAQPHPIMTRPGDVLVDPATKQPFYTNTVQKAFQPTRDPELEGLVKERALAYAAHLKAPKDGDIARAYNASNDAVNNYKRADKKAETPSSVKAGTKVKNSKGEIKYTKTDGTLPEGWTPAQ